jgi:Kef-type K+ transport system membrane component KefB
VLSAVKAIAQLGIILYMFVVGLDLNTGKIQDKAHTAVAISHASIVVPFLCGAALALWLFPTLAPPGVAFTSFSLFLGAALAITAFPVLARILTDRGLAHSEMGVMALTCAAADDVTAWCLLAFVVGVAQSQIGGALLVGLGAAAFIATMLFVVRPLLVRAAAAVEGEPLSPGVVLLALAAMLLAALATEAIGIHAVFGPFLLGAMAPHDSRLARELTARLRDVTTLLLLPAFFALTGMRAEIGLLAGGWEWLVCGAIILVATAGKVGGTLAAARICGQSWRNSLALGALMNTRGLMGLIVLHIGLDLGVISPTLYTMMVVMALATTLATSPALWLLGIQPDGDSLAPGNAAG